MAESASASFCRNCGARLAGEFCHRCGQRRSEARVPLRELLGEAFRELSDLESRLVVTLRSLLTKPGHLTGEYVEGRRVPYMPPIRLFLLTSVVFGASLVFSDALVVGLKGADPDRTAWLRLWVWSVFFMTPVFAGLMMIFLRRGRYFVEHLVLALHFHAFAFLMTATALTVLKFSRFPILGLGVVLLLPATLLIYLILMLRRRYELRFPRSIVTAVAVSTLYIFVLFVVFLGTGFVLDRIT